MITLVFEMHFNLKHLGDEWLMNKIVINLI